jgi:hypothetical protein
MTERRVMRSTLAAECRLNAGPYKVLINTECVMVASLNEGGSRFRSSGEN